MDMTFIVPAQPTEDRTKQPGRPEVQRVEALAPVPVFGTAQPLRGLSGVVRRLAYKQPEHRARKWMLLIAADRIDALEHGAGRPLVALGIGLTLAAVVLWMRPRWRG